MKMVLVPFFLVLSGLIMTGCEREIRHSEVVHGKTEKTLPASVRLYPPVEQLDTPMTAGMVNLRSVCSKIQPFSRSTSTVKISNNLLCAAKIAEIKRKSFADVASGMGILTVNGGVAIDIVMNSISPYIEKKLKIPGVTIRYISKRYKRVYAVVNDPNALYEIAEIPEVKTIMAEYGVMTQ